MEAGQPETKNTLPWVLLSCVKNQFLAAVLPRLFLIIFRYSQPMLIKETIQYVTASPVRAEDSHGFWLVVSAATIYSGLAVRNPSSRNRLLLV